MAKVDHQRADYLQQRKTLHISRNLRSQECHERALGRRLLDTFMIAAMGKNGSQGRKTSTLKMSMLSTFKMDFQGTQGDVFCVVNRVMSWKTAASKTVSKTTTQTSCWLYQKCRMDRVTFGFWTAGVVVILSAIKSGLMTMNRLLERVCSGWRTINYLERGSLTLI